MSIGPSRTLAGKDIGKWANQSSHTPLAVHFWVRGNQPALRAMLGYSSSVIPSGVQLSIIGRAVKPKPKIWGELGVALKSIRELISSHRGPTRDEKHLEVVSDRNGSPVLDQTLLSDVSFIHSEDGPRGDREITDPFMLWRSVSWDWGRIPGDDIVQGVCRKRRSAEWRSPVQHFGSWGRTPVQRWNRHG
ncbi:MAG: hypothetical protein ACRC8Y_22220 [Chroococcales cyanobacterium]